MMMKCKYTLPAMDCNKVVELLHRGKVNFLTVSQSRENGERVYEINAHWTQYVFSPDRVKPYKVTMRIEDYSFFSDRTVVEIYF